MIAAHLNPLAECLSEALLDAATALSAFSAGRQIDPVKISNLGRLLSGILAGDAGGQIRDDASLVTFLHRLFDDGKMKTVADLEHRMKEIVSDIEAIAGDLAGRGNLSEWMNVLLEWHERIFLLR
jgi:hypothetical protein